MPKKKVDSLDKADAERLSVIVAEAIETMARQPRISPSWVATEGMKRLNAEWMRSEGYPLVYLGCHLELRQIARQQLGKKFEPEADTDKETHPLFPELQRRYPVVRSKGDEPEYALLECLTGDDVAFNVSRLRADAQSRLYHADALEAWGRDHLLFGGSDNAQRGQADIRSLRRRTGRTIGPIGMST